MMRAGPGSYVKGTQGEDLVWSWDYSENPYNLDGIVDLRHSLGFGVAGLLISRVHPYLEERVRCIFE